jgi:hypothetical protein
MDVVQFQSFLTCSSHRQNLVLCWFAAWITDMVVMAQQPLAVFAMDRR